jgi:hypothetical protein
LIKKENNNYLKSLVNRNSPDIGKINGLLNWEPNVKSEIGFKRVIESFNKLN